LTPGENQALLDYALTNEPNFEASAIIGTADHEKEKESHRRSKVLYGIRSSKWKRVFQSRLKLYLPHIQVLLNVTPFRLGNFEIQLTASNDDDYYKAHADHSPENAEMASRQITYVYYLSREPMPFTGGGFLLYRHWPDPSSYQNIKSITTITPRNNDLIAFASNRWHELDIVRCPSGKFADSRFTVNGWLHPARSAA
jgi:Rps23 Pro-64 3,4-dihydroxylase Tpa1-like proline 4-hydroxylase